MSDFGHVACAGETAFRDSDISLAKVQRPCDQSASGKRAVDANLPVDCCFVKLWVKKPNAGEVDLKLRVVGRRHADRSADGDATAAIDGALQGQIGSAVSKRDVA